MAWMNDVKVGKKLLIDWIPFEVMKSEHLKVAMGKWMEKTVLKNLLTGNTMQKTFREVDKVEFADITYVSAEYLYADNEWFYFMKLDSYDQCTISKQVLGDAKYFLNEWDKVVLQEFNGETINVQLEPSVVLEIKDTPPWERWDTATGWKKPATLVTGFVVQVPLFLAIWDKIKVDTRSGEYLWRA